MTSGLCSRVRHPQIPTQLDYKERHIPRVSPVKQHACGVFTVTPRLARRAQEGRDAWSGARLTAAWTRASGGGGDSAPPAGQGANSLPGTTAPAVTLRFPTVKDHRHQQESAGVDVHAGQRESRGLESQGPAPAWLCGRGTSSDRWTSLRLALLACETSAKWGPWQCAPGTHGGAWRTAGASQCWRKLSVRWGFSQTSR